MQYVKDATGDEWILDMNLGVADVLDAFTREAYQTDFFDAVAMMSLMSRPTNVVSIASCLCRKQREEKGLTPEDFGRRWWGEAAYKLQRALWEEYKCFFPDPRIAALLSSTIQQLEHLSESEETIVRQALSQLTTVMEEAVAEMKSTIDNVLTS